MAGRRPRGTEMTKPNKYEELPHNLYVEIAPQADHGAHFRLATMGPTNTYPAAQINCMPLKQQGEKEFHFNTGEALAVSIPQAKNLIEALQRLVAFAEAGEFERKAAEIAAQWDDGVTKPRVPVSAVLPEPPASPDHRTGVAFPAAELGLTDSPAQTHVGLDALSGTTRDGASQAANAAGERSASVC